MSCIKEEQYRKGCCALDMNTFFVSCERLTNSELNGIPLIIGGGERDVVASCYYEARRLGLRSAMPIQMAMKLCPQAKIMKRNMELYSSLSHDITEIIQEKARSGESQH